MPQTLLHKYAVKWFAERAIFEVPMNSIFPKSTINIDIGKTVLEFRKFKVIIPDVKLTTDENREFAIEIVVTSDIHEEKRKLISAFNLPTLRIDLSDFYLENTESCRTNPDFIQTHLDELLMDMNRKEWISARQSDQKSSGNSGCVLFIVILLVIAGTILIRT